MEYNDLLLEHAGLYDRQLQDELNRETVKNYLKYGTEAEKEAVIKAIDDELDRRKGTQDRDEDDAEDDDYIETYNDAESSETGEQCVNELAYSLNALSDTVTDVFSEYLNESGESRKCTQCGKSLDDPSKFYCDNCSKASRE